MTQENSQGNAEGHTNGPAIIVSHDPASSMLRKIRPVKLHAQAMPRAMATPLRWDGAQAAADLVSMLVMVVSGNRKENYGHGMALRKSR